jgi:hypothetical protein
VKTDAEIGRAILERLRAQAAANRASGERLYSAVRAVWLQHPDHTAKQVIKCLSPEFQNVSVRRTQELLKRLRTESAVSEAR